MHIFTRNASAAAMVLISETGLEDRAAQENPMPAATTENLLALPRIPRPNPTATRFRPVIQIVTAPRHLEGAGFEVRRPFPGTELESADPFLLLDHLGAVEYGSGEAKGAPWHPHRGFETVTYIIDGAGVGLRAGVQRPGLRAFRQAHSGGVAPLQPRATAGGSRPPRCDQRPGQPGPGEPVAKPGSSAAGRPAARRADGLLRPVGDE